MCKYCDKRDGYSSIVEKDRETFVRIVFSYPGKIIEGKVYIKRDDRDDLEEPKITYIIFRNKIGSLAAEIHYCPFCGEKL